MDSSQPCPAAFACGRGGECLRSKHVPWRGGARRSAAAPERLLRALHETSLYLADESVATLAQAPPPFGFGMWHCITNAKDRKCFSTELCRKGSVDSRRLGELLRRTRTAPPRRRATLTNKTCAVVGNSGTLRHAALGAEIDTHDAVIRVQGAPLGRKHAPYVGLRTTLWVRSSLIHAYPSADGVDVVVVCNMPRVDKCHDNVWRYSAPRYRLRALSPRFLYAVRNLTGGLIPLTGIVAIMLALKSCASVSAYGFYGGANSTACRYYYDCSSTDGEYNNHYYFGFHRTDGNLRLLRALNASGAVRWRDALPHPPMKPQARRRLQEEHGTERGARVSSVVRGYIGSNWY